MAALKIPPSLSGVSENSALIAALIAQAGLDFLSQRLGSMLL